MQNIEQTAVTTVDAAAKSYIRTVVDVKGNRLQAISIQVKNGFSCYVINQQPAKVTNKKGVEVDGFKTVASGARTHKPDYEAGKAFVENAIKIAVKDGWTVPEGPRGFVAAPDAFDLKTLPKPVTK